MKNFILVEDNLLTKNECDNVIKYFLCNREIKKCEDRVGYYYADHYSYQEIDHNLSPLLKSIKSLRDNYIKIYPESKWTSNDWDLPSLRFKWWKPGDYYKDWHSEHNLSRPNMILGFMIYLSNNDCSTEFYRYGSCKTKLGRGIMFPTFFTHTHRGSPCKKGLDRYAISGYYYLI